MNQHLNRSIIFVTALSSLLMGCSKSAKPTSPSGALDTSGATSTTAGIAFDGATAMAISDSLARAPYGLCGRFGLPLLIPIGCPYDAASQSFVCGPDVLPNGLTETHSYQFRDAGDAPQTAYDATTTASVRFASHLSGTRTGRRWSTVDDQRALVVSGLAGRETSRIWNGSGSLAHQDSVVLRNGTRALIDTHVNTTVTDVVIPVPYARDSWPLSGSIASHVVVSGGPSAIDQTSSLTFNGTRYATVTVGDSTFTIDLGHPPHGPRHGDADDGDDDDGHGDHDGDGGHGPGGHPGGWRR